MRRAVGCCCVRSGLAFLAARFLPGERGRQLTEISTVPINLGTAASTTESSQNAKAMPKKHNGCKIVSNLVVRKRKSMRKSFRILRCGRLDRLRHGFVDHLAESTCARAVGCRAVATEPL